MNDNNYPKSSCPCEFCEKSEYLIKENQSASKFKPCSLSTSNCSIPFQLNYCNPSQRYHQNIQPQPPQNIYHILNNIGPELDFKSTMPVPVTDKKYGCRVNGKLQDGQNTKVAFLDTNPLTFDGNRGQRFLLDRPKYTGEISPNLMVNELYSKKMSDYGQNYTNYNDISGGSIRYWTDKKFSDSYFNPLFVSPSSVTANLKMNPMTVSYVEYERTPLTPYIYNPCEKDACDSYTHDQLSFRQDITEGLMRKMNQQNYTQRYYDNSKCFNVDNDPKWYECKN
jgi:hypothetical protein